MTFEHTHSNDDSKAIGPLDADRLFGPRVKVDRGRGTVELFTGGQPYEVDLRRVKTERDLLAWTHHLASKRWITREMLKDFIRAVHGEKQFDLHVI